MAYLETTLMVTVFNYAKYSSSPAVQETATKLKENVGWDTLSPLEQELIKRRIFNEALVDIHDRIKALHTELSHQCKSLNLDEKSSLVRVRDNIRQLDVHLQNRRMNS